MNFFLDFFNRVEKRLDKTGKQIIVIHILPNFSRSKGNQTMKFGQLVEDECSPETQKLILITYYLLMNLSKNHKEREAKD